MIARSMAYNDAMVQGVMVKESIPRGRNLDKQRALRDTSMTSHTLENNMRAAQLLEHRVHGGMMKLLIVSQRCVGVGVGVGVGRKLRTGKWEQK
jgi:hypothetical protein